MPSDGLRLTEEKDVFVVVIILVEHRPIQRPPHREGRLRTEVGDDPILASHLAFQAAQLVESRLLVSSPPSQLHGHPRPEG
jgi:hypothetical protein